MEYLEEYDFTLQYHPGKANVVADALSRKSQGLVSTLRCREWRLHQELQKYELVVNWRNNMVFLSTMVARPVMISRVVESQSQDENLVWCRSRILSEEYIDDITIGHDDDIRYKGKLVVPQYNEGLKQAVLAEAHNSRFSIHP